MHLKTLGEGSITFKLGGLFGCYSYGSMPLLLMPLMFKSLLALKYAPRVHDLLKSLLMMTRKCLGQPLRRTSTFFTNVTLLTHRWNPLPLDSVVRHGFKHNSPTILPKRKRLFVVFFWNAFSLHLCGRDLPPRKLG